MARKQAIQMIYEMKEFAAFSDSAIVVRIHAGHPALTLLFRNMGLASADGTNHAVKC